MTVAASDHELLHLAAHQLGLDVETLMTRYYGSPEDAHLELEELRRTGQLQPSFVETLRLELEAPAGAAE